MIEPKLPLSEYGELFEYTQGELEAVASYTGQQFKEINSLFVNDGGQYEKTSGTRLSVQDVARILDQMPSVYAAMIKSTASKSRSARPVALQRGTSREEAASLSIGTVINRITSAAREYVILDNGIVSYSNVMSFATGNSEPALVETQLRRSR